MDIHFQALCSAVEHEKVEKCRAILAATPPPDLSALNADGFSPLDLAFCTGHEALVELLLRSGAREGGHLASPEAVSAHLLSLVAEAKKQVDKFAHLMRAAQHGSTTGAPNGLSQAQLKECEKQQSLWQKRVATLRRLRQGFEAQGRPHAPPWVAAEVVGSNCVSVRLHKPELGGGQSLFTKYKIQWSRQDSFVRIEGEVVEADVSHLTTVVDSLTEGHRYFIRASFGNPKGFGPFSAATPKSVVPSSWRGVEDRVPRLGQQLELFEEVLNHLVGDESGEAYEPLRHSRRKGLRQLFTSSSAPKLQKGIQPGRAYLCAVLFHEDKVLMTNEEILPLMEIGDQYPANLANDYQWFAKLCHAYGDVERLKHESSKLNHGSAISFRLKLLQAVQSMQHALGICDLGLPYYKPVWHGSDDSVLFCVVSHIRSPKSLVTLSLKWVPLSKAQRVTAPQAELSSVESLCASLRDLILFHQVSAICLSKGLYLGYLQAESSLDSMKVFVSNASPSILPYIKVRDNPHVTCDEWAWINKMGRIFSQTSSMQAPSPTTNFLAGEGEEGSEVQLHILKHLKPTEAQFAFGNQLEVAMTKLFESLDIPPESRGSHRLFDAEIFELSPEISVILLVPPGDSICSVADAKAPLNLQREDLLPLPVHLFETFHLSAYFRDLLTSFCRTTLYLEFELLNAKLCQREAFSNKEVDQAQSHLSQLVNYQQRLEDSWKDMRWILDVLAHARRKDCGVKYEQLSDWYSNQTYVPDDSQFNFGVSRQNSSISHPDQSHTASGMERRAHTSLERGSFSSAAHASKLTRSPTTRSDPLEFHLSHQSNKENEVHNFPHPAQPPPLGGGLAPAGPASLSSLTQSHPSTNSSLSSTSDQNPPPAPSPRRSHTEPGSIHQPQYENLSSTTSTCDPRITQSGRFANLPRPDSPEPNVLQVFAAYDTGLASGTSVKLNVTHSTTAREVIDLVIKQLNMAVILKGKEGPIYENERLKNFCLVAVIGNRERCLRDDFKPLNLQNPWKKGRLFVRMKNDLLAAIEHISRHSTML